MFRSTIHKKYKNEPFDHFFNKSPKSTPNNMKFFPKLKNFIRNVLKIFRSKKNIDEYCTQIALRIGQENPIFSFSVSSLVTRCIFYYFRQLMFKNLHVLIVAPNKEKVTPKLSKKYPLKSRKVPPNIDPQIKRNLPPNK